MSTLSINTEKSVKDVGTQTSDLKTLIKTKIFLKSSHKVSKRKSIPKVVAKYLEKNTSETKNISILRSGTIRHSNYNEASVSPDSSPQPGSSGVTQSKKRKISSSSSSSSSISSDWGINKMNQDQNKTNSESGNDEEKKDSHKSSQSSGEDHSKLFWKKSDFGYSDSSAGEELPSIKSKSSGSETSKPDTPSPDLTYTEENEKSNSGSQTSNESNKSSQK